MFGSGIPNEKMLGFGSGIKHPGSATLAKPTQFNTGTGNRINSRILFCEKKKVPDKTDLNNVR
jgi:hypothetical protein